MENTRRTTPDSPGKRPIAVVLLNWNGARLLREFLPGVIANTDAAISRIVVADNGSDDGSVEYLRSDFPAVEVLPFDRNYGFAEGYNRALAAVDNEYVVLLNNDAVPLEGWDIELLEYMEHHRGVGACQPKILSYTEHGYFDYAGAAGGYLDRYGYPYCRGRIFGTCEADGGQYDDNVEVHWASGAALMVRRKAYMECGGLDPSFFAHMEEIDLCWRMRLEGWSIAAVGSAAVLHMGGASLAQGSPKKTYLNFRNNLLMLHKNIPSAERRGLLFRRRLLDTVAWAKYMLTLDFANASAILKAHRDYRRMSRDITVEAERNLLGIDAESRRSIVADYYLKGRRTFGELLK